MQDPFFGDILKNAHNRAILDRWSALALPDGWLVAGCLFQTVWNLRGGRPPAENIKDYDVFYFDDSDTSEAGEEAVQAHANAVLADLGVAIEVSNQARVHVWYESYFGYPYEALRTACDGIDRFLIMATCVGIRPGEFYAPHGLSQMYNGVLTMNPLMPYRDLFERKAASYRLRWPWLEIQQASDLYPRVAPALLARVKAASAVAAAAAVAAARTRAAAPDSFGATAGAIADAARAASAESD